MIFMAMPAIPASVSTMCAGMATSGRPASPESEKTGGAGLPGEVVEQLLEERLVDGVGKVPGSLAAGRLDEGGDVQPFVAVVAERDRPLAGRRPDAAADRLQSEPVLVDGPDLDRQVGMRTACFDDGVFEFFLNASCSSGVAAFGWHGRAVWIDQPIFFSASQPRCG
jgi:hypothetical protein